MPTDRWFSPRPRNDPRPPREPEDKALLSNLRSTPLHPAIVHLPIALTLLVPVFAIGALIAISRGGKVFRSWGIAAALLATLSLSAFVSLETGEQQEDRVEGSGSRTHPGATDTPNRI